MLSLVTSNSENARCVTKTALSFRLTMTMAIHAPQTTPKQGMRRVNPAMGWLLLKYPLDMKLGHHGILRLFPNASPDLLAYNTKQIAIVERDSVDEPLEEKEVQRPTGSRVLVRIESVRKRLLDEDNLCEKYHVDLLRYAGVISGDEADKTKIETSQRKAKKGEEEKVIIEVFT